MAEPAKKFDVVEFIKKNKVLILAVMVVILGISLYMCMTPKKEGLDNMSPVGAGTVGRVVPQVTRALTDRVHSPAVENGQLATKTKLREKRAEYGERLRAITPVELLPPVMRGDAQKSKEYENKYRWVKNFTSGTERILKDKNFVDFSSPRFMGAVNPPKKNMNVDIRKPPAVRINKNLPLWLGMPDIPNQAADLMRKRLD